MLKRILPVQGWVFLRMYLAGFLWGYVGGAPNDFVSYALAVAYLIAVEHTYRMMKRLLTA